MVEEKKINREQSQERDEAFIIMTLPGHKIQRHNAEVQLSLYLCKLDLK